jgi:hypothetical protein
LVSREVRKTTAYKIIFASFGSFTNIIFRRASLKHEDREVINRAKLVNIVKSVAPDELKPNPGEYFEDSSISGFTLASMRRIAAGASGEVKLRRQGKRWIEDRSHKRNIIQSIGINSEDNEDIIPLDEQEVGFSGRRLRRRTSKTSPTENGQFTNDYTNGAGPDDMPRVANGKLRKRSENFKTEEGRLHFAMSRTFSNSRRIGGKSTAQPTQDAFVSRAGSNTGVFNYTSAVGYNDYLHPPSWDVGRRS